MFKQEKKDIANFIIKFKTLAMKANTDELHVIFLLKKNVWMDIIKTILEYPLIAAPETFKEWKIAIISVEQGYESTESRNNYRIGTGTTYGDKEKYPWILRNPEIILIKTGNWDILIAMHTNIWQKSVENQKEKER